MRHSRHDSLCTRPAWAELVIGKKAPTMMLATLTALDTLRQRYGLRVSEAPTDDGAAFAGRATPQEHAFEAPPLNLGIRPRDTRPYRPPTNGPIDRLRVRNRALPA